MTGANSKAVRWEEEIVSDIGERLICKATHSVALPP